MNEFIEQRSFRAEYRADDDGSKITGEAAVYNQESKDMGGFVEVVEPGFFSDVMNGDTRGLFNHERNYVMGRLPAGTLRLFDRESGLGFEIDGPFSNTIQDLVLTPMKRGDIDQCSFAFTVKRKERGDAMDGDEWREDAERGLYVRTLKTGGCKELLDVSVVTYPAYPQTSASVREYLRNLQESDQDNTRDGAQEGDIPNTEPRRNDGQEASAEPRRLELDLIEFNNPYLKEILRGE